MKKSALKKKLSQIEGFKNPRVELEQYQTPAELAADIIHSCVMQGNEEVIDLGTGTGILAIGSSLAGLEVKAVEIDPESLKIARENAKKLNTDVEFINKDITDLDASKEYDSVIMNPPFNIQSEEGTAFWKKALQIGKSVYGVAGKGFEPRLKRLCEKHNHQIIEREPYKIALPASYSFHTESSRNTPVDLYVTRKINDESKS